MNSLVVYKCAMDKFGSKLKLKIYIYKNIMQKHKNTSLKQKQMHLWQAWACFPCLMKLQCTFILLI